MEPVIAIPQQEQLHPLETLPQWLGFNTETRVQPTLRHVVEGFWVEQCGVPFSDLALLNPTVENLSVIYSRDQCIVLNLVSLEDRLLGVIREGEVLVLASKLGYHFIQRLFEEVEMDPRQLEMRAIEIALDAAALCLFDQTTIVKEKAYALDYKDTRMENFEKLFAVKMEIHDLKSCATKLRDTVAGIRTIEPPLYFARGPTHDAIERKLNIMYSSESSEMWVLSTIRDIERAKEHVLDIRKMSKIAMDCYRNKLSEVQLWVSTAGLCVALITTFGKRFIGGKG